MKLKDLVVLQYNPKEGLGIRVIRKKDNSRLHINLKKRTWSAENNPEMPIGNNRTYVHKTKKEIIGVYNKGNVKHLKNIIYDAIEFKTIEYSTEIDDP